MMIGSHFPIYCGDPEAERAFFRDLHGFRSVDVGEGWLMLATPPAEAGIHRPAAAFSQQHAGYQRMGAVMHLAGEDPDAPIEFLKGQNVPGTGMPLAAWGRATAVPLPRSGQIDLDQPLHTTAFNLNSH